MPPLRIGSTAAAVACLLLPPVGRAQAPASARDPGPAGGGCFVLQIEGDAKALTVAGATARSFAYRAPRGLVSAFRICLCGADGKVLETVPLDLDDFCLDADHLGDPPHVRGDVLVAHRVSVNVKVPARADAVRLRIEKVAAVAAASEPAARPVVLGEVDRAAVVELARRDGAKPGAESEGGAKRDAESEGGAKPDSASKPGDGAKRPGGGAGKTGGNAAGAGRDE